MHASKNMLALLGVGCVLTAGSPTAVPAQQNEAVAHNVSVTDHRAAVTFELADGQEISLTLSDGILALGGAEVAEYRVDEAAGASWRDILSQAGRLSAAELLEAIIEWSEDVTPDISRAVTGSVDRYRVSALQAEAVAEAARAEAQVTADTVAGEHIARAAELRMQQLDELVIDMRHLGDSRPGLALQLDGVRDQLDRVSNLGLQVEDALVHMGDITIPSGQTVESDLVVLAGDVSIFGVVEGNVIALDGDVILHRGGSVLKDVVSLNGRVARAGGTIGGDVQSRSVKLRLREAPKPATSKLVSPVSNGTSLASLLGMFVALSCIGFGFTYFGPRQLDVVADTVTESFGKSFFAGLFATPLVPAAFVTLLIGLVLTVVGILLVPFAIAGGILAIMAAATGGYLAVAKSVGSTYLARRMAQGHAVTVTPFRSLIFGLIGLMAIWLPAALLGWIPVVGPALALLAAIFSWVMATAGFGAAILSRAGLRATFANSRGAPALTDEYYWPMDTGSHSIPARNPRRSE